ncbi:cytochrome C [Geoalkalibacter subterraneus]|uniref:cytochrome C n=1 Tax=Geoalkalibacter subterraneus TaxID=483547 RepID=UPI001184B76B|nr:cytochrome C [Geoalkalibacter subterraneus]
MRLQIGIGTRWAWRFVLLLALSTGSQIAVSAVEAASFHRGGVGNCGGCHTMHNSEGGLSIRSGATVSLLRASDPGSICLNCHAGAGGPASPSVFSFDGSALTPGGDFYWVTRTFSWNGGTSPAEQHGHNVIARDFNLSADPQRISSPGGSYPASQLSCISCHDPHGGLSQSASNGLPVSVSGSYGEPIAAGTVGGNYRLLGDSSYAVRGYSFREDAPIARQNPSRPFVESDDSHVDYGSGMSEWCGNCHRRMVTSKHNSGGGPGFRHPSGSQTRFDQQTLSRYNAYIRSGDLSGTADSSYLQFTPFERGISDPQLLDPTSTRGPDANSNVMCLTCHRAHASAFPYAGRWDFTANLLADSHPALGDGGASASDVSNSYYGRDIGFEFGADQGSFCGKCHEGGGK